MTQQTIFFRVVTELSPYNRLHCHICEDNKQNSWSNYRGKTRKAFMHIIPIDAEGNRIAVNGLSAFFVCKQHFEALQKMGRVKQ